MNEKNILIIGGVFGGVACALALARHNHIPAKITLVSDKPHLEYTPALYRVVAGRSPLEVCIPLSEIFSGQNVVCITDTIKNIDLLGKKAIGSSGNFYQFDYVVIALGSQTTYFNLPGLDTFSFGFKSITEALRLNTHIHKLFANYKASQPNADTKMHFVIVGAGASGIELSGELAGYTKKLAKKHKIPSTIITIDLIEAAAHILPSFPEIFTSKIEKRLRKLRVNIFTNRQLEKEEVEKVYLKGMTVKTDTVIWTAGIEPNALYSKILGLSFDKKGKILTDEYLRAGNSDSVFIVGDGASTRYSGMAQTAIYEGKLTARNIVNGLNAKPLSIYKPKQPYYSFPIGPFWAATLIGPIAIYGRIGWLLRKMADLRYFFSILSVKKAIIVFRSGKSLCNNCKICSEKLQS